ncbi:RidA family protein [soil metagenome]
MKHTLFYSFAIVAIGFLLYLNFRPSEKQKKEQDLLFSLQVPKPIGPSSQVVRKGNCFFVSGQFGIDVKNGKLDSSDISTETKFALENIKNILAQAHLSMDDIASATFYLTDMNDFERVNDVYSKYFVTKNFPALSTVEVYALPRNAHIEISVIAVKE